MCSRSFLLCVLGIIAVINGKPMLSLSLIMLRKVDSLIEVIFYLLHEREKLFLKKTKSFRNSYL